jgi:hypothetical protein
VLRDCMTARRLPSQISHRTPGQRVEVIEKLRRLFVTAAEIAEVLGMALRRSQRRLSGSGLVSAPGSSRPSLRTATSASGPVSSSISTSRSSAASVRSVPVTASPLIARAAISNDRRQAASPDRLGVCPCRRRRRNQARLCRDPGGRARPHRAGFLRRAVAWFACFGIAVELILLRQRRL